MAGVANTRITGIREYYRRVTEVDIEGVARELLGDRVIRATARLLQCDCPHHASDSKTSLHVMLDKQGWYCHGCGVGGDVLQLVEFVQSGEVTRGRNGPMPESHRLARDFLAERAGLPLLAKHGLTPEQMAEAEAAHALSLRVFAALTGLADFYYEKLLSAPEVLAWFQGTYRIGLETIKDLKIGWADNQGVIAALTAARHAFTLRELASTGAFRPTPADTLDPFFEHRIVFPYWSRGRVVFAIGRKTPWTPDNTWEAGKYKKLPAHGDGAHGYVASCVDNAHLYNEDVLLTRPPRLVITEGITDCISLIEAGFPAVTPATVRIREDDWGRIMPKLSGVKTVFIAQDNEISEAGLSGALKTAGALRSHGIDTRIVILPLDSSHEEARAALRETYGIEPGIEGREFKARLDGFDATARDDVARLLGESKIDVNAYFAGGHTAEEFEGLLASARTPLELAIHDIPADLPEEDRNRRLAPVLEELAALDALEQTRHLKIIQVRFGRSAMPIAALRKQVSALEKERRTAAKKARKRPKATSSAPVGSCKAVIEESLATSEQESGSPDYARAAEAAFEWFRTHGASFFRTRAGEPFMFFEDEILWMDTSERTRKRLYQAKMYQHTGLVPTTSAARTFFEALANLATTRGEVREQLSWFHADVSRRVVYVNLNNDAHEIAKVSPSGIEVLRNGGNADGIILGAAYKMAPISVVPDADLDAAERLLTELVTNNMTCAPRDRLLVISWVACFPLLGFTGTRPMMRFEGHHESGKSTASKLFSTLVFGSPQQKIGTTAANFVDGSRNPIVVLDNIESRQMTEEMTTFFLTCVTGITKEKRKGGTDSDTVAERPNCLLNTTGIEPIGGELSEVLSRSLIVRFSRDHAISNAFLEAETLARICEHRDLLMTLILRRTSQVLALLQGGAQARAMALLHETLGPHAQRRANDYLALMYLMCLAGMPQAEIDHWLDHPLPAFFDALRAVGETTRETARESNPIATVLAALFRRYRHAVEADGKGETASPTRSNRSAFIEQYQLDLDDDGAISGILARELYVSLKRFARDYGLGFAMTSVQQFAQRFANDIDTIRRAGFEIRVNEQRSRVRTYDILQVDAPGPVSTP